MEDTHYKRTSLRCGALVLRKLRITRNDHIATLYRFTPKPTITNPKRINILFLIILFTCEIKVLPNLSIEILTFLEHDSIFQLK